MAKELTFAQEVVERTGKSVYAIELEIAKELFINDPESPGAAWQGAVEFIRAMEQAWQEPEMQNNIL